MDALFLLVFTRYGFRGNPKLVLSAKPYVGEREVSLSPITDWIEKKLAIEFQVGIPTFYICGVMIKKKYISSQFIR